MSAPDPGKIQKFREMLHQEWTGVRRPSAAFNVSMEERLLFTDRGYSGIAAPAQGPFPRAAILSSCGTESSPQSCTRT